MFMLCEGRVRCLQAHTFYFPNCTFICSYIYKVSDIRPCIFPSFSFFFEQDGYEVKVALASNRFENPLEDIVFLDSIQLKTQNTTFKSFLDD